MSEPSLPQPGAASRLKTTSCTQSPESSKSSGSWLGGSPTVGHLMCRSTAKLTNEKGVHVNVDCFFFSFLIKSKPRAKNKRDKTSQIKKIKIKAKNHVGVATINVQPRVSGEGCNDM